MSNPRALVIQNVSIEGLSLLEIPMLWGVLAGNWLDICCCLL